MKAKIKRLIDEGGNFLVATHIDPDGDAVGSAFAFALALSSLGKHVDVYFDDRVPYRYAFLPGPDVIHELPDREYDTVFVLDCGTLFRIGKGQERVASHKSIVNIDHHTTNDFYGAVNLVDPAASSTGEIVYRLLKALKIKIDKDIAVNIYTAVFTDTGSMRYENTGLEAFRICEEMVRAGVVPAYVANKVYESHPKERFILLGEVLCTLKTYNDTVAVAHVTADMFSKTGTNREFSDGFVEIIKEIQGVEVAILIREINRHLYKISMRAKGTVDVAAICTVFGGGGHKNAAGCKMEGTIDQVQENLLDAVRARQQAV
jgi:bifunctional oligoribonuclease and PAP phosphatase NrnA